MHDADDLSYLMSPEAMAAETIRNIYQSLPLMPSFSNWGMNWASPSLLSVSISDWIYENPTNPGSLMQPWFVLLTQAIVGLAAYKFLPIMGHAAMNIVSRSERTILNASGYDTAVDLDAPKPKAGYLKAMLVGTVKVAASCVRYIAAKSAHLGGTLAAIVNIPRILNAEQMQMIRNIGLNPWLQRDLPRVASFIDSVKQLSLTDVSNAWETFNTQGAHYTSQGISAVTDISASIYSDPIGWSRWGVDGATDLFGSAWQMVEPTVTSALNSIHGCTRDLVSTGTYGLMSGQGLEPYIELGALALASGLYWRFGRVTINNTNTNTVTGNHVIINAVERTAIANH